MNQNIFIVHPSCFMFKAAAATAKKKTQQNCFIGKDTERRKEKGERNRFDVLLWFSSNLSRSQAHCMLWL